MKMTNNKRYLLVMILSIAMNQAFYILASDEVLNLPVWLDIAGTAFAAIALEPAAGILVGFVNNFYLAVTMGDNSNIIYFAVSAAVAVICGLCMRRGGKVSVKRILPTIGLLILVTSVLSTLLTVWRNGGIPDATWEMYYFNLSVGWGWPQVLSCFFGTFVIKVYDTLATAVIVAVFWLILPKFLKFPPAESRLPKGER